MMADKMLPLYRINTAEDIVQDMYLKIYDKIRKKKLIPADIIIDGKPHYGIVYTTLHDLVVNIHRTEKPTYQITRDIEDRPRESEAEFYEKIDNVIDNFHWFHKKLFKLYSKEFRSIRKLSDATKISYKTVFKAVKECKEEIKKQIKNER